MTRKNSKYLFKIIITLFLLTPTFLSFANSEKALAVPIAAFSASATTTCLGSTVTFTDESTNAPTSWNWVFAPATVTFQNGTTATSQNPQVTFDATGNYNITLTATNADGSDLASKTSYVVGSATVPFFEGFTTSVPPADWAVINPDGSQEWNRVLLPLPAGGPLGNPTHVARMDNYSYNAAGQLDELVLPAIDLSTITNPRLIFYIGYAAYGASNFERLHIEYSTDCGVTFNPTSYDKEHLTLATTGYQTSGWAPAAPGDWRIETIDISAYASTQTIFKFIQTCGYGNGLFIEDLKIEANPLPVELTYFKAEKIAGITHLTWQTASEKDNEGFFIEKSTNGTDWQKIGFVTGKGSTSNFSNYEFRDNQPSLGINYYRLKQVDFDGKHDYSTIESITFKPINIHFSISPNPTNAQKVNVQIPTNGTKISIFDSNGSLKYQGVLEKGKSVLSLEGFATGLYFVKFVAEGESKITRLVVN